MHGDCTRHHLHHQHLRLKFVARALEAPEELLGECVRITQQLERRNAHRTERLATLNALGTRGTFHRPLELLLLLASARLGTSVKCLVQL